jgi:hypothetical protein
METEQKQENAETTPAVVAIEPTSVAGFSEADLGKVRDLVLKAHPEVVPELVRGGSIDELIASVTPAQSAYQQIAERVRAGNTTVATTETTVVTTPPPPVVPAGGTAAVVDPVTLSPTTKISQALAARKKK